MIYNLLLFLTLSRAGLCLGHIGRGSSKKKYILKYSNIPPPSKVIDNCF